MTFQLKNFKSIVAAMVNYSKATQNKLTDFHVGSVTRTLFEAPAIEIDEFYQQVFFGLLDAIPVAVYKAFNFERLPSACASGTVRFTLESAQQTVSVIPASTEIRCSSDNLVYYTVSDISIPAGEIYGEGKVVASATGTGYNKAIGELDELSSNVSNIDSVTNTTIITGGRDTESDDDMKTRFIEYVSALSKSTVKAVLYGVKQATVKDSGGTVIEYVTQAGLVESPGIVNIYIYGSGGIASDDLISNAQTVIDGTYDSETGAYVEGYRPTGVGVFVSAMSERPIDLSVSVRMEDTTLQTDLKKEEFKAVVNNILASTNIAETVSMMDIKTAILGIPGVIQVSIENSQNVTRSFDEVLKIGVFTVEWI